MIVDPYWSKVVISMPMDGPNGSNVFYDLKGHPVEKYGSGYHSNGRSKFASTSAYFNGSDAYLAIPHAVNQNLGSEDFTIEFQINWDSYPSSGISPAIVAKRSDLPWSNTSFSLWCNAGGTSGSGQLVFEYPTSSSSSGYLVAANLPKTTGVWTGYTLVRKGNSLYFMAEGVVIASGSITIPIPDSTTPLLIGAIQPNGGGGRINAYLANVRITKAARYLGNFSVPTAAFPTGDKYWDKVVLALNGECLADLKGHAGTNNGIVLQPTPRFGNNAWNLNDSPYYSFNNSTDFLFGAEDFTIEYSLMLNAAIPSNEWSGVLTVRGDNNNQSWASWISGFGGGYFGFSYSQNGTTPLELNLQLNHTVGVWCDYAIQRKGISLSLWRNGVLIAYNPTAFTGALYNSTSPLLVGRLDSNNGGNILNGLLDNVRVTKGQARYALGFTPQQYYFGADKDPYWSNVVLAMDMEQPWDVKGKVVSFVGNASFSSAKVKSGLTSLYCGGSGDYLSIPGSTDFDIVDSLNMTWECYFSSLQADRQYACIFSRGVASFYTGSYTLLMNTTLSDGKLAFYVCSSAGQLGLISSVGGYNDGSIHHVAITKSGTNFTLWVDGINVGTATLAGDYLSRPSSVFLLGIDEHITGRDFSGYIDGLRITKGVARYSSNFTPAYPVFDSTDPYWDNVVLGMPMEAIRDLTGNHQLTVNGSIYCTPTSYKYDKAGLLCNGGWLSSPATTYLRLDTVSAWTIEMMVKIHVQGPSHFLIGKRVANTGTCDWELYVRASSLNPCFYNGVEQISAASVGINQWHHFAVCFENGLGYIFLDGVLILSGSGIKANGFDSTVLSIGNATNGTEPANCTIDQIRITKGINRYKTSISVPTKSFMEVNEKVLSGVVSNKAYISTDPGDPYWDDVVFAMDMESLSDLKGKSVVAYNSPVFSTAPMKVGGHAITFNGTNQYLETPASIDFAPGTGDFTVEFYGYKDSYASVASNDYYDETIFGPSWDYPQGTIFFFLKSNTGVPAIWDGVTARFSTLAVPLRSWFHVAWVRSSGVLNIFTNGLLGYSSAYTSNMSSTAAAMRIGGNGVNSQRYYVGSMAGLKITKGVGRYTANFTPAALSMRGITGSGDPYWDDVVLAMNCNSLVNLTPPKFNPNTTVIDSVNYKYGPGSIYCNNAWGSLDASANWDFQSTDFCMEGWIRLSQYHNNVYSIFSCRTSGVAIGWIFGINSIGKVRVMQNFVSAQGWPNYLDSIQVIPLGAWTHVAFVRKGQQSSLFVNGVCGAVSISEGPQYCPNLPLGIGAASSYGEVPSVIWLDSLRITRGVARYNPDVTLPAVTVPTSADAVWPNVSLCMPLTSSPTQETKGLIGAVTNTGNVDITTVNGQTGAYFNGSNQRLDFAANDVFNFGTGDFSIEWRMDCQTQVQSYPAVFGSTSWVESNLLIRWDSAERKSTVQIQASNALSSIYSEVLTYGVWHHFCFFRKNGVVYFRIDGVLKIVQSCSAPLGFVGGFSLGYLAINGGSSFFKGMIRDVVITKGKARYDSSFTPTKPDFHAVVPPAAPTTPSTTTTVITEEAPGVKKLRVHHRDTGNLVAETYCDPVTGVWSVTVDEEGPHYVVGLDDNKNAVVLDKVVAV